MTSPLQGRFQAALDDLRAKAGFPGATAAYILPDGTVGVVATGLADVEAGTPMTAQSRMLAASIGKTFVAATALALAQEGRLGLDDPVSKWLGARPWFTRLPNHEAMTVRHLLTHTAGLPDHVNLASFARAYAKTWNTLDSPLPPEVLIGFILDRPALFEAGHGLAYSDTGYILLGLIIEAAAQDSYDSEVTRRFLLPLQLTLTEPSDRPDLPGLAAGYTAADNPLGLPVKTTIAPGVMAWNPAQEWTGGGLVSNPRDLVIWARALYEGRAMAGPYLDDLLAGVPVEAGDDSVQYGAGVTIMADGPLGPSYGHGGWIPGYVSVLRYYPDHRIAIAIQINTDDGVNLSSEMELRLARTVTDALAGE